MSFVYDEGRNNAVAGSRVIGPVQGAITTFVGLAGGLLLSNLAAHAVVNVTNIAVVNPALLVSPVGFTTIALFPFDVPVIAMSQVRGREECIPTTARNSRHLKGELPVLAGLQ